mmetsp:Transcript_37230/g.97620  ORF Transcript_37230/g.97620 Transcript_37230/m.97620 type:complete len:98 (-) Transcript_37230:98-391(-)
MVGRAVVIARGRQAAAAGLYRRLLRAARAAVPNPTVRSRLCDNIRDSFRLRASVDDGDAVRFMHEGHCIAAALEVMDRTSTPAERDALFDPLRRHRT